MWYRVPLLALVLVPLLALTGCGNSQLGQVTGKVTFNGQPLFTGTITFLPDAGRPAYGKIKDGQIIEVTTFTANDGAIIGAHKVTIQALNKADDMYAPRKSLIAEKYGDPKTSKLTADIKPGTNELTFAVD